MAALAAGALLLLPAGVAGAQATDRQTASVRFTTTEPGAPSGSETAVDWRNPSDPQGKPYSVAKLVIRLHPGTVIDTSVQTQCKASDAELQARGAEACPAASRVGGGRVVSDTGSSGGAPRFNENRLDNFNNDGELIGVADAERHPAGAPARTGREPVEDQRHLDHGRVPLLPGQPAAGQLHGDQDAAHRRPRVREGQPHGPEDPTDLPELGPLDQHARLHLPRRRVPDRGEPLAVPPARRRPPGASRRARPSAPATSGGSASAPPARACSGCRSARLPGAGG